MCGPPVIFFLMNQDVEKQKFRANFVAYIVVMNLATLIPYYLNGLLTGEVLDYCWQLTPVMIIGGILGIWLSKRINEKTLKVMVFKIDDAPIY